MARSGGNDISTRIGFSGDEDIKKRLIALSAAVKSSLNDVQRNIASSKNPFSGLSDAADEVKRHFDNLSASSQRSGNTIRASLVGAIPGAQSLAQATDAAAHAHGGLSIQAQAAFHSVRSMGEQIALGVPVTTLLTQQLNHLSFAASGPGGITGAFGELVGVLGRLISPMVLVGAGVVAIAAGFGLLIARASSADQSAKSFDITLQAIGKSQQITGKQLEEGAQSLRDVGLSASEARDALRKALVEGVRPQDAVKIVRIGANVAAALGEGKDGIDRFTAAAGKGGQALQDYGEKLGIIPKFAKEVEAEMKATADAIDENNKRMQEFNDILAKRNQAVSDDNRRSNEQEVDDRRKLDQDLKDLTRTRGTAEEELRLSFRRREEESEVQKNRRLEDINRQANRAITDMLIKRNRDNAKRLKDFNDKIAADAQTASDASLLSQIDRQTKDAAINNLSPIGKAFHDLSIAWNELLNSLSQSSIIKGAVTALGSFVTFLSSAFKTDTGATIAVIAAAIAGLGVAALVVVPIFSALASSVTAVVSVFSGLIAGVSYVATGLTAIVALVGWPAILLAGVVALVASFVNWGDVLSGKTWSDFLDTMGAFLRMLGAIASYVSDTFLSIWNTVWDAIKNGFAAVVQFFSDQINTVKGFFSGLGDSVGSSLSKALGVIRSAAGLLGLAGGGLVPGFAGGGSIYGPSGTDRVPIWATAGEYMIKKPSVDFLGVGFMNMVNRFPERIASMMGGGHGFASGGLIDWQPPIFADRFVSGGLIESDLAGIEHDRVSVDLKMPDGEVFVDMLTPRTVASKFGRYARQRNRVAIGRRPEWQA